MRSNMSIEKRYCLQTGKNYIGTSNSEDTVIYRLIKQKQKIQEQKELENDIERIIKNTFNDIFNK